MNENMAEYKPDWREASQRLTDWWDGKEVDRPLASVMAPLPPEQSGISPIDKVPDKYTDIDTVFHNLEYTLKHTFWGGEALPRHDVYFGPMFTQTFFGNEPIFMPNTTWYEPSYESLDEILEQPFQLNNKWWNLFAEMTRQSVERSNGRYLTTLNSIVAITDLMAGLLGNENLLVSMVTEPEKVKAVRDKLSAFGRETYEKFYGLTHESNSGSIDGMSVWSPKRMRTSQCDLCVMISPTMFNEFVKDELASTYSYVDHGIYHLDGEGEIQHLDTLFTMDKIKTIQWIPSSYDRQDPMGWIDLIKRIQETGRRVIIERVPPECAAALINKIDRNRAFLRIRCPDQQTAQQTLRQLEKC